MTAVTYNAARSLVAGRTVGLQYSLDLRCVEGYPARTRKVGVDDQRTLNDSLERLRYFGKATWQVQVLTLSAAELLALREFLDSTEGGEPFSFDEFGSIAAPGALVTAKRTTPGYSEQRIPGTGATRADDACQVTFDVEQA
jgi:hypothetical protein